jgi:thymidine kinase
MLTIICGPMFSGKTTELLKQFRRSKLQKLDSFLVCSKLVGEVETHDGNKEDDKIVVNYLKEFTEFRSVEHLEKPINIFIDEGHFFMEIYEEVMKFINYNHNVTIATLTTDYTNKPFINIAKLLCHADKINRLTSICKDCKSEFGIVNNRIIRSHDLFLVGKEESYEPLCLKCFNLKKTLVEYPPLCFDIEL